MPYTGNGSVETSLVDFDDPRKYEALVLGANVVIRLAHFPLSYFCLFIHHLFLACYLRICIIV